MNLKESLSWRSAVKIFDENQKLDKSVVRNLLETTLLSASSFGLQPWKFVNVSDTDVKKQLQEAGYGQSQFSTSSHVIVFAVKENIDAEYVEKYMQSIMEDRGVERQDLDKFSEMLNSTIASRGTDLNNWSARQVYIAIGTLLAAASLEGIDCSPMEGFDGNQFDTVLGLKDDGYHALAAVALGHRSTEDSWSQMKKSRFTYDQIVKEI